MDLNFQSGNGSLSQSSISWARRNNTEKTHRTKWCLRETKQFFFSCAVIKWELNPSSMHIDLIPPTVPWQKVLCLSHFLNLCNSFSREVHTLHLFYVKYAGSCLLSQAGEHKTSASHAWTGQLLPPYLSSYVLHSSLLSVSSWIPDSTGAPLSRASDPFSWDREESTTQCSRNAVKGFSTY